MWKKTRPGHAAFHRMEWIRAIAPCWKTLLMVIATCTTCFWHTACADVLLASGGACAGGWLGVSSLPLSGFHRLKRLLTAPTASVLPASRYVVTSSGSGGGVGGSRGCFNFRGGSLWHLYDFLSLRLFSVSLSQADGLVRMLLIAPRSWILLKNIVTEEAFPVRLARPGNTPLSLRASSIRAIPAFLNGFTLPARACMEALNDPMRFLVIRRDPAPSSSLASTDSWTEGPPWASLFRDLFFGFLSAT
mmetsp:Transcript_8109/g.19412  ORF Transcript_8109/g.19412 Transcript_8109/m.19412 type:complete len:247 (+) Transcript_8109:1346-2086(+)